MAELQHYREQDYHALCRFLIDLNREDRLHINWNWARLEWMIAHPEFDKSLSDSIGIWYDDGRIVGAAIYDMYFGEAFCAALPEYRTLYPEVLRYAWENLRDDSGLAIAVRDDNTEELSAVQAMGFAADPQEETILRISLQQSPACPLPEELHLESFDPAQEPERFQWLLWQGFDHGQDRAEFLRSEEIIPQKRPHLKKELSVAAVDSGGESVAYCCVWYHRAAEYAYVEPVCTIPGWRRRGAGRAVVCEALNRAAQLGAKEAFVISDQEFYRSLGFEKAFHYSFFRKQ